MFLAKIPYEDCPIFIMLSLTILLPFSNSSIYTFVSGSSPYIPIDSFPGEVGATFIIAKFFKSVLFVPYIPNDCVPSTLIIPD